MDKKKPKSHWFLTNYTNRKRMYKYNMNLIEEGKNISSPDYNSNVDDFVKTINQDEQQYTQKANKQMKFAKWGALLGLVGPVLAMSLGFFIFSLATAMLPGQFLITTGIAVASALTLFGALPRWLAHRSHKRVRLARKYKSKIDTLEKTDEKTKTESKSETKSEVKAKTEKRTITKEAVDTNDLTYTTPLTEEEVEGFANVEAYELSGILKNYDKVIWNNEENDSVLTNNSIYNQVAGNVDTGIVDSTTTDTEVVDNTIEAEIVDNAVETDNIDDSVTIDDTKETIIEESSDTTVENDFETTTPISTTETKSDQTVTEPKTNEEVSKAVSKKLGRYKFEVISTRTDKNGKGAISTKVVAFSANSQEAFLEKMRKFCSNRSKNKKRLDTEFEQSVWLSEGNYPSTLQFKVTDIFHQGKTMVSKVYSNAPTTQKGENIETFMLVVDSLRKTWSARLNKKSSNKNSQEYTTGISSETVTPDTYTDISGAKFSVPNELKPKAQTYTTGSNSEVVTPDTYTDVSGSDFSIKDGLLNFEAVTPSTYTDVSGADFNIKTKAENKGEYVPDTYTDVSGSDFSIKVKANNEDEYAPDTYTDVSGAKFSVPNKLKPKAQTFTMGSNSEIVTPDTYTDVSGSDFSIKTKAENEDEYTPDTYTDVSGANFNFPKKPVKVKIVSDYMEWDGKKNGKKLSLEDLKTSAKTKTIDVEEKKSHTLVLENDESEKKDDKMYYTFNDENELTH